MAGFLSWQDKAGYAVMTIDRPDALNALNEAVLEELSATLRQHEQNIRMKASHHRGGQGVCCRRRYRSNAQHVAA